MPSFRLPLIGPEDQPVALLTQIVAVVRIAQQRHFLLKRLQFADRLGDQILVRHGHHRNVPPDHAADFIGVVPGRVDHDLGMDAALVRHHIPGAVGPLGKPRHLGKARHLRTFVARALGESLGELRRIDVAVFRIPGTAQEIVRLQPGIVFALQLLCGQHLHIHAGGIGHGRDMLELLHAFLRMRQAHGARHVPVDGIADLVAKPVIEARAIVLQLHQVEVAGEIRRIAGRVPGRTGCQFVLFDQQHIALAGHRQMIETACADGAAADDDDTGMGSELSHGNLPVVQ